MDLDTWSLRENRTLSAAATMVAAGSRAGVANVITFNFDDLLEYYLEKHGVKSKSRDFGRVIFKQRGLPVAFYGLEDAAEGSLLHAGDFVRRARTEIEQHRRQEMQRSEQFTSVQAP